MTATIETAPAVTDGQALTAALRRYFSVGPRTRRYRKVLTCTRT